MEGGDCEGRGVALDHKGSSLDLTLAPSSGRFKLRQELRVEGGGRAGTLAAVYKSETCLERITRTTTRAPARQPEEARDLR